MNEELKDCPFCGSENVYIEDGGSTRPWWYVKCKCGCRHGGHETDKQAIDSWNNRVRCLEC